MRARLSDGSPEVERLSLLRTAGIGAALQQVRDGMGRLSAGFFRSVGEARDDQETRWLFLDLSPPGDLRGESISNHTHVLASRVIPHLSASRSTINRPLPDPDDPRGAGNDGAKPWSGSCTSTRSLSSDTESTSVRASSGPTRAWRTLLATSSLTISRTSSRTAGAIWPGGRLSRARRAARGAFSPP
jgi:hypothetical protein